MMLTRRQLQENETRLAIVKRRCAATYQQTTRFQSQQLRSTASLSSTPSMITWKNMSTLHSWLGNNFWEIQSACWQIRCVCMRLSKILCKAISRTSLTTHSSWLGVMKILPKIAQHQKWIASQPEWLCVWLPFWKLGMLAIRSTIICNRFPKRILTIRWGKMLCWSCSNNS